MHLNWKFGFSLESEEEEEMLDTKEEEQEDTVATKAGVLDLTRSGARNALTADSNSFMLLPIAVVGVGRSGTTLLMAHLARDERILFDRTYAFETRLLSFVAKFCQTIPAVPLFRPEIVVRAMSESLPEKQPFCLGTGTRSTDLKFNETQLLLSLWSSISLSSRENNPDARFYAEKTSLWLPVFLQDKLPIITIFLFRDPKDVFLSQIAFSEKINANAFQANEGALRLAFEISCLFEEYLAQENKANSIVVKYEDMVTEPETVLNKLREVIGWQPSAVLEQEFYDKHRTTKNPAASIGRYKTEQIASKELFYLDCVPTEMLKYFEYSQDNPSICERLWKIDLTEEESPHFRIDNADLTIEAGSSVRILSTGPATAIVVSRGDRTLEKIAEVWLCVRQTCQTNFALYWRQADQGFGDDRFVVAKRMKSNQTNILRFKVGEHPGWSDQFAELFISGWHQPDVEEQQPSVVRWIKFIPASEG